MQHQTNEENHAPTAGRTKEQRKKIKRAVQDELDFSTYWMHPDGALWLTPQLDAVRGLKFIDKTVASVAASAEPLYVEWRLGAMRRMSLTELGKQFRQCFNGSLIEACVHYPRHKFSPFFELFRRAVEQFNLKYVSSKMITQAELEACAKYIRETAKEDGFRKTLMNHERCARKNYAGLVKYLRALHEIYSKLIVIRLDLYYSKEPFVNKDVVTPQEVISDREKFLDYVRTDLAKKDLVGYAWKTEHAHERSFHHHVLLIFNGQKVHEDITIADAVGRYWVDCVTGGNGHFNNCNRDKGKYHRPALGEVRHDNVSMRENLEYAALYLTKTDYYVKLQLPGSRAFGRGELPSGPVTKRGRPRDAVAKMSALPRWKNM